MSTKYAADAAGALAEITRAGTPIFMSVPIKGVVNDVTDTSTGDTTLTAIVQAVILPGKVPLSSSYEQMMQIRLNVRELLIAGKSCPPREIPPDTRFSFGGSDWYCKGSIPLAPDGGDPIIHTVTVQR